MGAASAWPTPSLTAEVPAMPVDAAPVPAGAIPVGEDVYMVPVGADRDGCGQFRMFSTKSRSEEHTSELQSH